MATYFTTEEGGIIYPLQIKSMHQKIIRRNKHKKLIHSIFLCKNGKVLRIWDSSISGYRNKKFTKGLKP